MKRAWTRRSIVLLVLGVLPVALLAGPASAHAELESSDPAAGVVLDQAPAQVTIVFTEPPDLAFSAITVLNAGGQEMQSGPAMEATPSFARGAAAGRPARRVYTVSWTVVSSADGHASAGSSRSGRRRPRIGGSSANPAVLDADAIGGFGRRQGDAVRRHPALDRRRARRRVDDRPGYAGPAVDRAGRRRIRRGRSDHDAVRRTVLARRLPGRSPVVRLPAGPTCGSWAPRWSALVAAITVAASPARWGFVLLGMAGIVAAAARAAGGHAAAASPAWAQEAVQTVHMVAASVWVGGLVPILVLLRARRRTEAHAPIDEVRRFSSTAGWAVLVVVATGLIRVVNEEGGLGSVWSRLTDSSYGTTLIVKISVVVVVIALGAWNRLRSIPRLADGDRLLSRVMTAETAGALVIVVTTGDPHRTEP
jgi:copper transport protein